MKRTIVAFIALTFAALPLNGQGGGQADSAVVRATHGRFFSLEPGTYAVGFRAIDLVDESRTYFASVTTLGEPTKRDRGRPLQTSVWYPARRSTAAPMRYEDYMLLSLRAQGARSITPADQARHLEQLRSSQEIDSATFSAIRSAPVRAVANVPPVPGRYPVVVYVAGGGQP